MTVEDIKNFYLVDERLGTAGQPTEDQLRVVAASGYEVVVNLGLLDPRYCLPDEAGLVGALGLEYHAIPVKFDAPAVEDFLRFIDLMDRCRTKKRFVHCAANYRVSSFVALYGQARLGWTVEQADAHARRFWDLDDVWLGFIQACRRHLGLEG